MDLLNLPLDLEILEVDFGELHKLDNGIFPKYDLVITSGAHLEMINKDYYELTYLVPFYPLRFTEADVIKSMVQSKKFGRKIMLMYLPEEDYDFKIYENILDIEMKRVIFSTLEEAEKLMMEYYHKGFNVVIGTSSICEIASKKGIDHVLVYSKDSLKLEIIKAYQFAATRNKMLNYSKVKDAVLLHSGSPIFILDESHRIIDTNFDGIRYVKKTNKNEVLGEKIEELISLKIEDNLSDPLVIENDSEQIVIEPIINGANSKTYLVVVKGGTIRLSKNRQEKTLNSKYKFTNIIHTSQPMKKVILKAKQYAQTDAPLLITGDSGTGKELIAHSVHQFSNRRSQPFLPVNCSAIPENILESELFGYEEGAFTGARKGGKPGFFEMAQHGTIFLDEFGEIPLETQTKLLRVLQEKEVIRLGGKNVIPLDVRVITATNKSLVNLVKKGSFREDLYYRINVLQIQVPSLRERKEDIPLILNHLLNKYGMDSQQSNYLVNVAANLLLAHNWPGNVRELENFAQRFCALNSVSQTTFDLVKTFKDILFEFFDQKNLFTDEVVDTEEQISEHSPDHSEREKLKIMKVLLETNGNKNKTALQLGMSRTTLWRKMKQYNI